MPPCRQPSAGRLAAICPRTVATAQHLPMIVRSKKQYRGGPRSRSGGLPSRPRTLPATAPTVQVPPGEVAKVELRSSGPSFIYREHQERYVPIKFRVRGRDLGSAVLEAQRKVEQQVRLPGGLSVGMWVGEFGNLQDALHRLSLSPCL